MRLGVIGTGRIADRFVNTALSCIEDAVISCVFNPRLNSAEKFAAKNKIEKYTDDIEEFLKNADAVYIASPHETHYDYAKKALESGRHVLCEKPASLSVAQVKELFDIADKSRLVFMEAVKTAYCPGFHGLMEVAASGRIGRITDVEAAFSRLTPLNTREFQAPEYNGSFLEFGTYVMLPVFKLLGCDYKDVTFNSIRAQNGVDAYTKAYFTYSNGMASVKTGLGVKTEGQLLISGTNGYILAKSPWWLTKEFEVRYEDPNKKEIYKYSYEGSGLQYELRDFIKKIQNVGKHEMSGTSYDTDITGTDRLKNESMAMAGVMEKFLEWNKPQLKKNYQSFIMNADTKPMPAVWAHRGCSLAYPENTLESFEAAAKIPGITGIELDVQFTLDKQIVVFYDENTVRVTGENKMIADCRLAELKAMKISAGEGKYTTIPTLSEVLTLLKPYCEKNGLLINIELKTSVVRYKGIEKDTYDMVKAYGMEKYIVWSSFLEESVSCISKIDADAKTACLAVSNEECIAMARKTKADALHPYMGGLVFDLPDDMKNKPVRIWNFDEPFFTNKNTRPLKELHLEQYKAYGATDIITNIPEIYLKNI